MITNLFRFPWVKLYIKLPVCSTILACQTFMHIFFHVLCLYEQQSMCQQVVHWSCPMVLRYYPFSPLTHFLHSPMFLYNNMNVLVISPAVMLCIGILTLNSSHSCLDNIENLDVQCLHVGWTNSVYIPACTYRTLLFTSNCHNFLLQFVFLKHLS